MQASNQTIKNEVVYDVDGNCYLEINSKKNGLFLCPVDEEDLPLIQQYKWSVQASRSNLFYVKSNQWNGGKPKTLQLHRIITGVTDPKDVVDHINHIGTDNRRCNLRVVTQKENVRNARHKGYGYHRQSGKYSARICLGLFDTEEEARAAYLQAKELLHNIPEGGLLNEGN